ncbi:MAG: response regulator transcription factor [Bacteroidales bacterium]|nr:response regulator transcription factor [Bacteroidales bacterium]
MLKAVIVEDEEAGRTTLQNYLNKYCPDVRIDALCDSVATGKTAIETYRPDIVFLDVEMPFGNGFDLLEQIEEINFETVFVTAYSEYAIKALNFSASYYILKPIDIDELIAAVDKIKVEKEKEDLASHSKILLDNIKNSNKQLHKIVLPLLDGFEVIQVKDIIYCKAEDNFTMFFLENGTKHLISRTLKYYEELLKDFDFVRTHKSYMINIHHVKRYKKGKGGILIMSNDSEVDVSAQRKNDVLKYF